MKVQSVILSRKLTETQAFCFLVLLPLGCCSNSHGPSWFTLVYTFQLLKGEGRGGEGMTLPCEGGMNIASVTCHCPDLNYRDVWSCRGALER